MKLEGPPGTLTSYILVQSSHGPLLHLVVGLQSGRDSEVASRGARALPGKPSRSRDLEE